MLRNQIVPPIRRLDFAENVETGLVRILYSVTNVEQRSTPIINNGGLCYVTTKENDG